VKNVRAQVMLQKRDGLYKAIKQLMHSAMSLSTKYNHNEPLTLIIVYTLQLAAELLIRSFACQVHHAKATAAQSTSGNPQQVKIHNHSSMIITPGTETLLLVVHPLEPR
jgi:hypothetical protein